MGDPLVLFNSCLIFVIFQANLTENLRVLLVAVLISHVAFKAGRVDELETESALGLFHLLWNDSTIQYLTHYLLGADRAIPCWTLSCSFKLQSLLKSFWQWQHWEGSKSVCFTVMCLPRFFLVIVLLQYGHGTASDQPEKPH